MSDGEVRALHKRRVEPGEACIWCGSPIWSLQSSKTVRWGGLMKHAHYPGCYDAYEEMEVEARKRARKRRRLFTAIATVVSILVTALIAWWLV